MSAVKAIACVLSAYREAGVTGSALRTKMTKAATAFEKNGTLPKRLVKLTDPDLLHPDTCRHDHIEGVTFFKRVRDAKNSPLYKAAEELGKFTPSPALIEARPRVGQTREEFKLRTASRRVDLHPTKQEKERSTLQRSQTTDFERIMEMEKRLRPKS